jgi:hypothetical protein
MSRAISLALRFAPASTRANDGAAIAALAQEMIDAGDSTTKRQAASIAAYGSRKRMLGYGDWLTGLPRRAALWMLALPLIVVQTVLLGLTFKSDGRWTIAVVVASLIAASGALLKRRHLLLAGSGLLLGLLLFDQYAPGGGMRGGFSHTRDFSFALLGDASLLAPVALLLIPTTLLLVLTGFVRPPQRRSESQTRRSLVLAAGLLLASQSLLIGVQLMNLTLTATESLWLGGLAGMVMVLALTAMLVIAVLLLALTLVRIAAGPNRPA